MIFASLIGDAIRLQVGLARERTAAPVSPLSALKT